MAENTNNHESDNGVYGVLANRAFFDDEWQFKQLNFTRKEWLDKDGKDDKFYTKEQNGKKQEIIEGNKLIAEFMGTTFKDKYPHILEDHRYDYIYYATLLYSSSWDWLMPVVEKIEELGNSFDICYTHCYVANENGKKTISTEDKTKIKAVWLAVVEFIKWYNQNKEI